MRNRQGITIAALIVAIIGLSIGFAAFSNTLTIRSSASVNPTNTMNVVFSSLNNGVGTTPVAPTLNTSATGFTATNATINGDTLSNLNVSFTEPGQSVTYSTNLYVYNDGNYQAQLTGITFEDADGSQEGDENPWKHCVAITENVELANQATQSLVNAACEGINISVTIGTAENVTPASLDKTLNHQIINVEGYLNARVTISYDGAYVDGPMSVTFGDIKIGATSAVNPALVPQEPVVPSGNTVVLSLSEIGESMDCSGGPCGFKLDDFVGSQSLTGIKNNSTQLADESYKFNSISFSDNTLTDLSSMVLLSEEDANNLFSNNNFYWIHWFEEHEQTRVMFTIKKNGTMLSGENYNSDDFKNITFTITGSDS